MWTVPQNTWKADSESWSRMHTSLSCWYTEYSVIQVKTKLAKGPSDRNDLTRHTFYPYGLMHPCFRKGIWRILKICIEVDVFTLCQAVISLICLIPVKLRASKLLSLYRRLHSISKTFRSSDVTQHRDLLFLWLVSHLQNT